MLEEIFGVEGYYITKNLSEVDKLVLQEEKLKKDLNAEILWYETYLDIRSNVLGEGESDLEEKPIYNEQSINDIELQIEKAKILQEFKGIVMSQCCESELYKLKIINKLLKINHKVLKIQLMD